MRLQRIYSSKLYVTSTRKDRIHAAMQDPYNVELVQQLAEYLDEDGEVELAQAVAQQERDEREISTPPGSVTPSEGPFASGGSAPSHSSFTGNIAEDFGTDDLADIPEDMGSDTPEPTETPEPVESVTKEGKPITSSCAVIWTTIDDVISDCETIKGTLNAREDTNGVIRLEVKEHELWIYFNDEVNLNDKMVEVISVLNSTGYTYLKFNRLARSNNAIVFDILLNINEQIKTIKEVEEETA